MNNKLEDYRELFIAFLENPNQDNFLKIRDFVISDETYAPYDNGNEKLEELYSNGEYEAIITGISSLMPNWLLSPRIHILRSMTEKKLGNQNEAEVERFIAQRCLDGILSTGDGSEAHPFLVTRTLDEYDILMKMEKELEKQSLVEKDGQNLDYLQCKDGTQLIFDITACFSKLS